jgi:hypothetical protein
MLEALWQKLGHQTSISARALTFLIPIATRTSETLELPEKYDWIKIPILHK